MPTEHIFATGAEAASDIAARIATILSDAIAARGVATIAVSGGRSPRPVLEALSKVPLDWTRLIDHGLASLQHRGILTHDPAPCPLHRPCA